MFEVAALLFDLDGTLVDTRAANYAAYAAALAAFGEEGVVDLVAFGGYYGLLAMVMNTTRTPAPEAAPAVVGTPTA